MNQFEEILISLPDQRLIMRDPRGILLLFFLGSVFGAQAQRPTSSLDSDREALKIFLENTLPLERKSAYNLSSDSPCSWQGISCSDSRVQRIDLQSTGLQNSIPDGTLGKLTGLVSLNLFNNSISGSVPSDIWELRLLSTLNLSANGLTGSITVHLRNASTSGLRVLDLSQNRLSGQIPTEIGFLQSLLAMNLSRNSLQDPIPDSIFNCTSLLTLDLSHNNLSGPIPLGIVHLTRLQSLSLNKNGLQGTVPSDISRLHYLTALDLSENQLNGQFPRLDGLRKLEFLNISNNLLVGRIPVGAFRVPALRTFSARNNMFVGSLPDPSLQSNLSLIDLGQNRLSGTVSDDTWKMNSLEILRLDGNKHLSGIMPDHLGPAMKELNLRENEFTGQIPSDMRGFQRLVFLELSENQLTGRVPEKPALPSLTHLGLAHNPFSDSQFPNVAGLGHLEYLNLSATRLAGNVPDNVGSLEGVKQMDVSHNSLSGRIPDSIASLKSLELLDMSYNHLSGQIPESLGKLTVLQSVNFSYNELTGNVPDWSFLTPSGLSGNKGLCGSVVDVPCPRPRSTHAGGGRKHLKVAVIVGIATGCLAGAVCLLAGILYCRSMQVCGKKPESVKEERYISMSGPFSSEMDPSVWAAGVRDPQNIPVVMFEKPLLNLTFADILQATRSFNKDVQLPDSAGCGPVFEAVLPGGVHADVKLIGEGIPLADVEAQLKAIGRLKHPNVVPLLGYCMVGVERLLIYEHVQDGGDVYSRLHELPEGVRNTEDWSRDTWEHGNSQEDWTGMPWPVRHRVALGAARALAFLHHGCIPPVVHGDVKASNILLDARLEARLAGTGLAQLVDIGGMEPGCVAPEFAMASSNRDSSQKGDVYAYGVVLLELISGKRPVGDDYNGSSNVHSLVQWTRGLVKEKRGYKALDMRVMKGDEDMNEMLETLRVAFLCTAEVPNKRPTMQQVVGLLKDLRPAFAASEELVGSF